MWQLKVWLNDAYYFFSVKSVTTCHIRTSRNASRQIGANLNSISFRGGVNPYVSLYERRFMFVKCALHDDVWWGTFRSAGGNNRQSSGFSRGKFGRVCGNADERRDDERNSTTNITLFLDRGVLRDERRRGPQDWCILSLELSPRVLRFSIPFLSLFPLFSAFFPVIFAPALPTTIVLRQRQAYRLFTLVSSKTMTAELFYGVPCPKARFECALSADYNYVTC